jgi:hypothetical protein
MWRRGWRRRGVTEPRRGQGGGTRRKHGDWIAKHRAWIAALVCVGILAGYGALIRDRRGSSTPATAAASATAKAPERWPAAGSPAEAAARPSAAFAKSKADDSGKIEVDFCGFGKVAFHADDPSGPGRFLDGLTKQAARRWVSALLDSDDNRARAAGLFLQDKIAGAGIKPMQEEARDALVQLAVGSGDPAVYATAVSACDTYGDSAKGACEQISLKGWAQLDPDNAVPWLLLAGKARARKDAAAEADAFNHAAKAGKIDAYNFSLLAYAEPDLPKDVTPLERWWLSVETVGIEAAVGMYQYGIATKHCSAVAVQDSDVQRQCSDLAEVFVTKGTNLLDFIAGTNIGARTGWSKERVADLKQEGDALMQAQMQSVPTGVDNQWTCSAVELGNAYVREAVQWGELRATYQALERSGETAADLAAKWREYLARIQREGLQRIEEDERQQP